jgi:lycopene beta-cyclase
MTTHFDNKRRFINKDESVIYLGTIAGAIKPTSGYGFKNMANYSQKLAKAISENTDLPTHYRKWRFRLYDTLLLQILDQNPERGKEIFQTLFKTQTTPKILRFLDEETTIWEEITIFSKLPILLFLNSLVKYIFK